MFFEDVEDLGDLIKDCSDVNSAFELIEKLKKNTQDIVDEVGDGNGEVTVVYDMNNNSVDYVINDDSTGYSYDTHNYTIALVMEDLE